jgi:hypothetical protein
MREAAINAIAERELLLSARDQQFLIDMLTNPPEPSAAFLASVKDYFETVSRSFGR